jgi:NDP-sugar pyrophosphorylase family protein
MKAMVLAAGLGTRLRPLTNDRPKALVEVSGHTLLQITLNRLHAAGIREVIVNVHHFADLVAEYLNKNANFGMRVEISREEVLLDTGGGLKKAAWFFEGSGGEPFLLHNVDVISNIDFAGMVSFHRKNNALATLAVHQRQTSRYLLFDEYHHLCGRQAGRDQPPEIVSPAKKTEALAFSGVHIVSPRFLPLMTEQGAFSIITSYLRAAGQGETIAAFEADGYYWRDLGRAESITQAEEDIRRKLFSL